MKDTHLRMRHTGKSMTLTGYDNLSRYINIYITTVTIFDKLIYLKVLRISNTIKVRRSITSRFYLHKYTSEKQIKDLTLIFLFLFLFNDKIIDKYRVIESNLGEKKSK